MDGEPEPNKAAGQHAGRRVYVEAREAPRWLLAVLQALLALTAVGAFPFYANLVGQRHNDLVLALLLLVVIGLWRLRYDRQTVLLTAAGLSVRHEYRLVVGRRDVTWATLRSVLLVADGAVVVAGQDRLHIRSSLRGFGGLLEQLRARLDLHTHAPGCADVMALTAAPGTECRPGVPSAWWWLVSLAAYLGSGVLTVPHRLPVTMWPVLTALHVIAVVPAMWLLPSTLRGQRARFAGLRATKAGLAVAASLGKRPTLVPWAGVGPCLPSGRRFILRTSADDFWVDLRWPGAKDLLRVVDKVSGSSS